MGGRVCKVLFHKVDGTTWPPDSVSHRMSDVSLEAIFSAAGIGLDCNRVEKALPALPGGRSFGPTDLHGALSSALAANRAAEPAWTACVLIVPEIVTVIGNRYRRPLGLMFDTGFGDCDGRPREGCAIAWRLIQGDNRAYLRTLAHELGHVFNLSHPGENNEPFDRDAVNTLMVPTESLRPVDRYPETIEFRFTAAQSAWLAHGPEHYVRPGGADYGARPADWSPFPHKGAANAGREDVD